MVAEQGIPDSRSAVRYLWWLITGQRRRIAAGAVFGSVWTALLALPPYLLARAIDDGLQPGNSGALLRWTAALFGVGVCSTPGWSSCGTAR